MYAPPTQRLHSVPQAKTNQSGCADSPASRFRPSAQLFLTHLQTYLDAYIARRQALDLVRAHYARAAHAALRFAVFASVSADRVTVEWDLPELGDDEAGDKEEDEDGPVAVSRQVVLQVGYPDLRGAAVGRRDVPAGAGGVARAHLLVRLVERSAGSGQSTSSGNGQLVAMVVSGELAPLGRGGGVACVRSMEGAR